MKAVKEPQRRYYDLDTYFFVDYKISSQLGESEMGRYVQDITGSIMAYEDDILNARRVGSIEASKVLISNARRDEEPMVFVWDWEQYLSDMSAELWDYEEEEFLEVIQHVVGSELIGEDLLSLNLIEIQPEFRGKDLGRHVIKDLYNNFISGCALFVVDFNHGDGYQYRQKHKIEEKKAKEYFIKELGFKKFKNPTGDYLLLSPHADNPAFEAITLL